jgi:hypothetical protein
VTDTNSDRRPLGEVIMNRIVRLSLFVLAAGAIAGSTARADPVAITAGFVDLDVGGVFGSGVVHLVGDRGFSYDAQDGFIFHGAGVFDALVPGTTAPLLAVGDEAGGVLRFDGVTYSDIGGFDSPANLTLAIDAPVPLPSLVGAHAVVTAPFVLNLDFSWTAPDGSGSFTQSFSGSGLALVDLAENNTTFGFPTWYMTHLNGELGSTPTPEPSTLLLMGSVVVGFAISRRRSLQLPAT